MALGAGWWSGARESRAPQHLWNQTSSGVTKWRHRSTTSAYFMRANNPLNNSSNTGFGKNKAKEEKGTRNTAATLTHDVSLDNAFLGQDQVETTFTLGATPLPPLPSLPIVPRLPPSNFAEIHSKNEEKEEPVTFTSPPPALEQTPSTSHEQAQSPLVVPSYVPTRRRVTLGEKALQINTKIASPGLTSKFQQVPPLNLRHSLRSVKLVQEKTQVSMPPLSLVHSVGPGSLTDRGEKSKKKGPRVKRLGKPTTGTRKDRGEQGKKGSEPEVKSPRKIEIQSESHPRVPPISPKPHPLHHAARNFLSGLSPSKEAALLDLIQDARRDFGSDWANGLVKALASIGTPQELINMCKYLAALADQNSNLLPRHLPTRRSCCLPSCLILRNSSHRAHRNCCGFSLAHRRCKENKCAGVPEQFVLVHLRCR